MICSLAFIGGFKFAIKEKLFAFWGAVLVVPFDANSNDISAGLPVKMDTSLMEQAVKVPGVTHIYPFIVRPGILQSAGEMEGIRLKGISPTQSFPPGMSFKGKSLNFSDTSYSQDIILSVATANRLNVRPGEDLRLYFLDNGTPRIRKLHCAGTYHTGMEEIDRQFALCDMRLVQHLSGWPHDDISGYQIEIANNNLADTMAAQVYEACVAPPMASQSITDVYQGVFSWLSTQDTNGRILLFIVGIVALINLASSMLILMVDRAVMIGILKALGMEPRSIWTLFLSVSGLIAGLGILFGNIIGIGLCLSQQRFRFITLPEETYNISYVPVRIIWWQILALDLGTLVLCLICTLLPLLYIRRIQAAKVLGFK